MSENIDIYRRLIEEGVGIGQFDVIDELIAPDTPLPTLEPVGPPTTLGLRQMSEAIRVGFPDLRATIAEIFENGDWVAARLVWTGTNTGEFMGQPPTGRTVEIDEFEIVKIENGKIVDLRQVADFGTLMTQLGG